MNGAARQALRDELARGTPFAATCWLCLGNEKAFGDAEVAVVARAPSTVVTYDPPDSRRRHVG